MGNVATTHHLRERNNKNSIGLVAPDSKMHATMFTHGTIMELHAVLPASVRSVLFYVVKAGCGQLVGHQPS